MTSRPWMPMYWGDYLADTAHFTNTEHGAYLLLIAFYWTNGKLPQDEEAIRRIAKASAHQWKKMRPVLVEKFSSGWRHKRIDDELAKSLEKSRINSANAKRRHNERTPNAHRSDTQSQPQLQTQEEQKISSAAQSAGAKPARDDVSRGTLLPDNWQPNDGNLKYATARGLPLYQIEIEATKFRNHFTSKSGRDARKRNWDRTWENWILNVKPNGGPNGHRPANGVRKSGGDDFFAGLAEVASNISGHGGVARTAAEEIPLGRVNIDG